MRTLFPLAVAALALAGCASTPDQPDSALPIAKQLVLMAQNARPGAAVSGKSTPELIESLARIKSCSGGGDTGEIEDRLARLTDEAIKRQTGLNREQIREAARLLASGQFEADLKNVVGIAVFTLPALERSLWQTRDVLRADLSSLRDRTGSGSLRQCAASLLETGRCGSDRAMIAALVDKLYQAPPVKVQRNTLSALLDNRSFRLALIAYAHANGVNLEEGDLDFAQQQIGREEVDLAALVNEGKGRLAEKYRLQEAKAKFDRFVSGCG